MSYQRSTKIAQALGWVDSVTQGIVPALHPSTTFVRDADNQYRAGFSYARDSNPSYQQPEALLAELEDGAAAILFASGMAAATAVFLALPAGSHVVAPSVMYWALRQWLIEFAQPAGLQVDFVTAGDLDALHNAVRPGVTRLIWLETPANPLWTVTDIHAAAAIAHRAGALLCVDSTVASPVLTRPLSEGADLVMHSATKYLNGHSDLIAGALVTAKDNDFWQRLRRLRQANGAILGTFEAWLLLRGMRTLHLRVERACQSALTLAERLAQHPQVSEVLYPGLPNHPGHDIAKRQMMGGFGGMLSLRVRAGRDAAIAAAAQVQLWKRATSLGSVESLIEHRASIEGEDTPVPDDLLRLSVGIEAVDDLWDDLKQAL